MKRIESFSFRGQELQANFQESSEVFPGVTCDVYLHPETQERDLGVITIQAGHQTRPQLVLDGSETIEGYISGRGRLVIIKPDGERLVFEVDESSDGFAQSVEVGDIMQWQADEELIVFEVCFPPYQDGRFKNLEENTL